jgi:hypothetical protein
MCTFLDALFEDMSSNAKFKKNMPWSLLMSLTEGGVREVAVIYLSRKTA